MDSKEQVLPVLLTEEGLGQDPVGEVHALPVRKLPACHHTAQGVAALQLLHPENDQAVVDHDGISHLQIFDKTLVGDGDPGFISNHIVGGKCKQVAILQGDPLVLKGFDPVFRPLGVQHDGNGQVQFLPDFANQMDFLLVLLVGAVRKVQARHIHARQAHLRQGLFIFTGRPDGADNFRFSHITSS